ncbi:MAG: HlyC/CorC family transporter [FCB group bacterium]|nr:HlyC/CorC family transporter [FCB group bacterium]
MITYIIIFILLLALSGFFSGAETAYFNLRTHRSHIPDDIKILLEDPRKLLVALLTGNTIVNIMMATIAAVFTARLAQEMQWSESLLIILEVFVVTLIILIFGEVLPKILAVRHSEEFAARVKWPLKFFILILNPIAIFFYSLTHWFMKLLPIGEEKVFDSEEELKILTEISEEQGTLQSEESDMIQSIFEFHNKTVHEVMTPRVDMVALPSVTSLDDVMKVICEKQFSKIPIYKEKIDDIKGILYAKDLLPFITGERPKVNLVALSRPPFFVPENKNIDELLEEFKQRKTNIAIAVDEWGGTSGMVTLEDVVEEVIGEIRDPYDQEESQIKVLTGDRFIVDGKMALNDIEEETDLIFPEERDYDTLGGFIFHEVGDVPGENHTVEYNHRVYTVKKMDGKRIEKVMVGPETSSLDGKNQPKD